MKNHAIAERLKDTNTQSLRAEDRDILEDAIKALSPKDTYLFGDYVMIEQNRYGAANELFMYKVINRLTSNVWVDVPVVGTSVETVHDTTEEVISCICAGFLNEKWSDSA